MVEGSGKMANQQYRVYEVTPLSGKRRLLLATPDRTHALDVARSISTNDRPSEEITGYQVVDEDDIQIFPELASSE